MMGAKVAITTITATAAMKRNRTAKQRWGIRVTLLAATTVGVCLSGTKPAVAQDAATIQSIQKQIQQLQIELKKLQADAAKRDVALKKAQDEAAEARAAAAASAASAAAVASKPTPTPPTLSLPASAPVGSVAVTMPPNDKDASGHPFFNDKKPNGTFNIGGITVTLGGFFQLDSIYRSRNENAGVVTNFNTGIPFPNSPNYYTGEYRFTAQKTRATILVEGSPYDGAKLLGYFESDFNSAGSSSNSTMSQSYTPRIRQAFAQFDDNDHDVQILAGQAYSLVVPLKSGLTARNENIPISPEDNYIQGFDLTRQPQIRVTTSFFDNRLFLGASLESPQSVFGGTKPTLADESILTGSVPFSSTSPPANTGTIAGGGLNPINSYSYNTVPDIIVKTALEPGFGHYELYGLARFFKDEKVVTGSSGNLSAVGGGIGASAYIHAVPALLDLSGNILAGYGIGRYGPAGLPDVTYKANGAPQPLPEIEATIGAVGHVLKFEDGTPRLDVFAYGGIEAEERSFGGTGANAFGYGNPDFVNTGCDVISAATVQPTCTGNTRAAAGLQVGFWYTWLHGGYGTLQTAVEYQYDKRTTFNGVGGAPNTNLNVFQVTMRYMPFQ
jgi:hypothetical protein